MSMIRSIKECPQITNPTMTMKVAKNSMVLRLSNRLMKTSGTMTTISTRTCTMNSRNSSIQLAIT
jgi:hypothetical protein